jgi:hypothetical protein
MAKDSEKRSLHTPTPEVTCQECIEVTKGGEMDEEVFAPCVYKKQHRRPAL